MRRLLLALTICGLLVAVPRGDSTIPNGAIRFLTNSTDKVTHAANASLNNIAQGTAIVIFKATTQATDNTLFRKVGTQVFRMSLINGGVDLIGGWSRSTTNLQCNTSNAPLTPVGVWYVAVFVWNSAGANGDQHVYTAPWKQPLVEATYATQQVGSGTHDDSSAALATGNNSGTPSVNQMFPGVIAFVGIWDDPRPLSQLQEMIPKLQTYLVDSDAHTRLFVWYGKNGPARHFDQSRYANHGTTAGTPAQAISDLPLWQ